MKTLASYSFKIRKPTTHNFFSLNPFIFMQNQSEILLKKDIINFSLKKITE